MRRDASMLPGGTAAESRAAAYLDCWAPEEDLTALCELAAQLCEAPMATIELLHDGQSHRVAAYGSEAQVRDAAGTLNAAIVARGEDVYLENVDDDPRLAALRRIDGRLREGHMFAAAVLRDPQGIAVGTLSVADPRPERQPERRNNAVADRRRMLAVLARQAVDLFELSLRTDELARTNAELARSQEHLAAFSAQVSHDLRAPLATLLAWVDLIGTRPAAIADDEIGAYLRRCTASGRHMMTLIEELLQYAAIGGRLARRRVTLDEVMAEIVEDLSDLVARGTITWSGADIDADPVQLRALLQNIVDNAFTFTRQGECPEVEVTSHETPGGVEIHVADNGSGIPQDQRHEVIRPLTRYRTDVPGTGIGLATCQRIVTDHGGTLEIRDRPGGGTVVVVTLPHRDDP